MRQRPKSEVTCDNCGQIYQKETRQIQLNAKLGHKNFCSSDCLKKSRTTSLLLTCSNPDCNRSFVRQKSAYVRNASSQAYCSNSCAASVNNKQRIRDKHSQWNGGTSVYRKMALEHHGAMCCVCGYNTESCLQVHHIDGNRKNNELNNLLVVCPTHHVEIERGVLVDFRGLVSG